MQSKIKYDVVESCNLCGCKENDFFLKRGDLYTTLPGLFTLVRCKNCGLVYENPRPSHDSWDLIYPATYGQYNPSLHKEKSLAKFMRKYGLKKRANFVKKYKPTGKLLDVGCATGDFLEEMQQQTGWDVFGIEPHTEASQYARSIGLNVQTGTLDDLQTSESKYDLITMWHVVEHLYDPKASLKIIHQLLKPNGIVILTTPNLNSLDAHLFGQYWTGFELPRHFYVFSKQTILELFRQTGFVLFDARCFYGTHAAFMSSIKFFLKGTEHSNKLLEKFLLSFPFRLVMSPIFYIFDRLSLSSPLTYIGIKLPVNEE